MGLKARFRVGGQTGLSSYLHRDLGAQHRLKRLNVDIATKIQLGGQLSEPPCI